MKRWQIIGIALFSVLVQIYAYNKVSTIVKNKENETIEDNLFDTIQHLFNPNKNYSKKIKIIKELLFCSIAIFFVGGIIYQKNIDLLFEYIYYWSLIMLIKSLFFSVTILPDSSQRCKPDKKFPTGSGNCHDLIFSGHVATAMTAVILLKQYNVYPPIIITILNCMILLGSLLTIYLRDHYTIDILVAPLVVSWLFRNA